MNKKLHLNGHDGPEFKAHFTDNNLGDTYK